jgi:antitoxin PrlF
MVNAWIDAMPESSITAKGQTTVPADIRALVDAKPGTRLVWSAMPDGTIIGRHVQGAQR